MNIISLDARMFYETSCVPKRKDHKEKHYIWCSKIDEITPDINYFKFYRHEIVRIGYIVECEVHDKKGNKRIYVSRQTSCIEGLKSIYKQIRDCL